MIPALLAAGAVTCLLAAAILLRTLGPAFRVGRLLSGARQVSIEEALEIAASGAPRFVRVSGRISSDEEFPDDSERPLVFRRTRIDIAADRGMWRTVLDEREGVTFGLETRAAFIGVDGDALGPGLVVIPREAAGTARDLPADIRGRLAGAPEGLDPDPPARLVIEQVSAVEHATVAGVPAALGGRPVMTDGLGRPLILTTLELPAAMRVLARGRRGRVVGAAALLAVGVALIPISVAALFLGL